MKRHGLLIAASALSAVIVGALLTLGRTPPPASRAQPDRSTSQGTTPLPADSPKATEQKYDEQVKQAVKGLNQPLRFWGRVVDQNGNPLAGVEVSYKARTALLPMFAALGSKESYGKTRTNADGAFYLDAGKGDMLGLFGFAKPGYRLAQNTKTGFAYAASPEVHRPNAKQPVVFVMYQEAAIEPLHHFRSRFDLACDGTPLTIDLNTGSPSQLGHLRVSLQRNPLHIHRGRPFHWSAKIEIVGGGLQKTNAEGAFIAPADGYVPTVEYDFRPTKPDWDPQWQGGIRQTFYFKTGNAKYGRMEVALHADSEPPPAALFVESWLNPSGSRSLEPGRTVKASTP